MSNTYCASKVLSLYQIQRLSVHPNDKCIECATSMIPLHLLFRIQILIIFSVVLMHILADIIALLHGDLQPLCSVIGRK